MVTASNSWPDGVVSLARCGAEVGQQYAERLAAGTGPLQDLLPAVLRHKLPKGTNDRRVRQAFVTHRHALTANKLRLPISQWAEQVCDEGLDDRRLARAGVASHDHKATAVVENII